MRAKDPSSTAGFLIRKKNSLNAVMSHFGGIEVEYKTDAAIRHFHSGEMQGAFGPAIQAAVTHRHLHSYSEVQ